MMRVAPVCVAVIGMVACGRPDVAAPQRAEVVYGADDRLEVFAHPSATHRALAESAIAIQMDEGWLDRTDPMDVRITFTRTLGEAYMLCPGEPFAEQIDPGTCSGTLIDEQHLITAGHCVDEAADCGGSKVWVFGFRYAAAGTLVTLTEDDVYGCARVLGFLNSPFVDHAVLELDRPVAGHVPAPLRPIAGSLPDGTPVTMIGHPNGIPMKIDSGGVVTWSSPDALFLRATVDAVAGSSGAGVFDTDGNLVAVLYGGATDYVDRAGCNVVAVIDPPPTIGGEGLTYLRPALEAFCESPDVTSTVCLDLPDAGPAVDAGDRRDGGGAATDAGPPAGPSEGDGGCSCRTVPGASRSGAILAIALLALVFRRRGRKPRRLPRGQAST